MKFLCLQASSIWERYGGIESYLHDFLSLATQAFGKGSCHTVTLTGRPIQPEATYPVVTAQKYLPGVLKKIENRFSLNLLAKALSLTKKNQPEFILCGHVSLGPLARLLAAKLKVPVVTVIYGIEAWGNLLPQDEWALKKSDQIISISEWTKSRLVARGYSPDQISVVCPTLPESAKNWPVRKLDAVGAKPLTLLTVARLDSSERYKGHDHVLQALSRARKQKPAFRVRYVIQGEGSDQAYLENIVRTEKLEDMVQFLPAMTSRENLGSLYSEADILVMPSRFGFWDNRWRGEGFGIVYVEAAACEVPSIAYACGGATDVIIPDKTGWLVHPDHILGLTQRFIELNAKRELITKMGKAARVHVEAKFSRAAMKTAIVKALS